MSRLCRAFVVSCLLTVGLVFAGCAGGEGAHVAPAPAPAQSSVPTKTSDAAASVRLTFTIPKRTVSANRSIKARRPQYISPSSTVASVVATGSTTITTDVSLTAAGVCATQSDGDQTCTISAGAPVGSVTFQISLADANNNVLSQGTTTVQTIVEGANSITLPVVLGAVVASIGVTSVIFSGGSGFTTGTPTTATLVPSFADYDGNVIPAGALLSGSIVLSSSDPSVTLGASTLTTVPTSIALNYSGSTVSSGSIALAAATGSGGSIPLSASTGSGVANGDFLSPQLPADTLDGINVPEPASFTVIGAGVNMFNGTAGSAPLSAGQQGIVLQLGGGGVTQTVTGLTPGAAYVFTLEAESWPPVSSIQVLANGVTVLATSPAVTNYTTYTTSAFTAPANGDVTLQMTNTGSADLSATNILITSLVNGSLALQVL